MFEVLVKQFEKFDEPNMAGIPAKEPHPNGRFPKYHPTPIGVVRLIMG